MKYSALIIRICILIASVQISVPLKAQSVEYFVKASFIEKFARFTEWEPDAIGDYFVVGVLGENPFYNELEKLAKKTSIKNKPIRIVYLKNYQESSDCQVVFICSSEKSNLQEIVNYIGKQNVLLVGDTPGYSEKGVHFNFYYKKNETLHFEINMKALVKANLKTDIQLLSLGKITN